jgi:hypothetical protein
MEDVQMSEGSTLIGLDAASSISLRIQDGENQQQKNKVEQIHSPSSSPSSSSVSVPVSSSASTSSSSSSSSLSHLDSLLSLSYTYICRNDPESLMLLIRPSLGEVYPLSQLLTLTKEQVAVFEPEFDCKALGSTQLFKLKETDVATTLLHMAVM